MKEKLFIIPPENKFRLSGQATQPSFIQNGGNHYSYPVFPVNYLSPILKKRASWGKRAYKRLVQTVRSALAGTAIGLMLLMGIWMFLVQLAEMITVY